MSPSLQAKPLRVLEEFQVLPVGVSKPIPIDVRVIAATHRDLTQWVRDGSFREDLLYRLDVVRVHIPPLRNRRPTARLLGVDRGTLRRMIQRYGLP